MPKTCFTLLFVLRCPEIGHAFNFSMSHGDVYIALYALGGFKEATSPPLEFLLADTALDRATGIKHLRVRGIKSVSTATFLKVTGWNIRCATQILRNRRKSTSKPPKFTSLSASLRANRSPPCARVALGPHFPSVRRDFLRTPAQFSIPRN